MTATSPPAASYCPLIDQAGSSQLVLYNSLVPPPDKYSLNSVWTWVGTHWTEINSPTNALRTTPILAYTGANAMLFGGSSLPSTFDTKELQESFDGQNWSTFALPSPPGFFAPLDRINAIATYIPSANQVVMFGGAVSNNELQETWVFSPNTNTWKHHQLNQPPWRLQATMASNGSVAIMFGGITQLGATTLNDVWQFSNNAWSQLTTLNTPSPRAGHAMIWEATRNRFVVFGGYTTGGVFLNETWVLDLGSLTWTQLTPNNSPSGRAGSSFCWDSTRQEGILWGGMTASGLVNDTFRWDGSNFIQVQGI
jgi:hypothetical protein